MTPAGRILLTACVYVLSPALAAAGDIVEVTADPATVHLHEPSARYSLLITGKTADGRLVDRTQGARFQSRDPRIARVDSAGVVQAVADGATTVQVQVEGRTLHIAVRVQGSSAPRRLNFVNDIEPILSRFRCNSSGCHGKAEGQNGFRLSVFGFDPPADYAALAKESRGRRIFPAAPEQSLLLRKMTGQMPHGGGVRIAAGSRDYDTVRTWIAVGVPFGSPDDPTVASIRIQPRERILRFRERQQLRVLARYSDGHEADVTAHAKFQSNNDGLASVQPSGLVLAGETPGDAAIMAGFMNAVDTFRLLVPQAERISPYPDVPENNFIDRLVFRKLRQLNILPSELAEDAEYLRRVYLDVLGTLPTPAEARRFFADKRPDRRARLVEELLHRPEFADFWALQWADLLRVDRAALGPKRAYAYYKWIHDSLAANRPFDEFARAFIAAEGPLGEVAPASFYKVVKKPGQAASTLAQVFLGVRIACAECHHHPFDRWSQDDYYGMTAFFNGVGIKNSGGMEALTVAGLAQARNPRTGADIRAHPLGEKMPAKVEPGDRREQLAEWLTSPRNPWFARNLANRVWAHFLGRGLVEPVDDVRATNPPSNPELLDALAEYLIQHNYDLHALIRVITASRVYQLCSKPNATNKRDEQNYSRALLKRPGAEVLLDMVSQTTGIPERFAGAPPCTRAIQLWDSKVPHYFLKVFGRPQRLSACECERNREPSVAQVLHLLNAPEIHAKLSHEGGSVAKLVKRQPADEPLIEELYLMFFSRLPRDEERQAAMAYLREHRADRREAVEDLAWSMLNSLEFLFNH
ncbi:MAG TPA: DUF1549 domain-containing protein [Gemmataceae bacterium]